MLLLGLWHATDFATSQGIGSIGGQKDAWCEILGIQDTNFALVDQYENLTLGKKEALVDALSLAYVETIQLDSRVLHALIHSVLIVVDTQLDGLAPRDRYDRIALVTESRCEGKAPVEIGHRAWLDVRRTPYADQRKGPRAHLSNINFF